MPPAFVGKIVREIPTGAVAGIGAKLAAGSSYNQTIDIWAVLVSSLVLAATIVSIAARFVDHSMGGRAA